MDSFTRIARTRVGAAAMLGLSACAMSAGPASAQQPATASAPRTISVIGQAQIKPTPGDRMSDASIRKSVADARRIVTPQALGDGRRRATELARLAGLPLGPLISIAETPPSPFGFSGPYGEGGTFGNGRYCGIVRRSVFRRDAQGRRRRVGSRQRRMCRVPSFVSANLTMVFASG